MKSPFRTAFVYDLETGGLKPKVNAITELAIVVVDLKNLEILEEYSSMIKPYSENLTYEEVALNITKISMEDIKGGKESQEVVDEILALSKKYTVGNNKPILVGHNIKDFDNLFFGEFMEQHKKDLYKVFNVDDCIDTLKEAHKKWSELANYSLGTVAHELGLTLKEAHRALPDTIANAKVFIELMKLLRGFGDKKEEEYVRRKYNFNF